MARKQRISWFVLLVWHLFLFCLHLRSSIGQGQHVSNSQEASIKHPNNMSAGMHLKSSSDTTIRVGEPLRLNCSIIGAVNASQVQLCWYHGNQSLSNLTRRLSNETIQLVIDQVSWINNGSYVCKEKGRFGVQPKSVMVIIGDIPSPPQDVWINNFEFRTYIHWKAPLHHGGLPLNYAVKGQCKNKSTELPECEQEYITLCGDKPEQGPGSDGFFCRVSALLHQLPWLTVTYIAQVEAINALGFGMSTPVEFTVNLIHPLSTTPKPPVLLDAQEVSPPGTVKLMWQDAKQYRPIEVEYTILYHKDGDSYNKSVTSKAPGTNVLISGLVGFSWYHFYLLVRYGERLPAGNTTTIEYGIYSEAVERKVRTNISAPKAPAITNCSEWINLSTDPGLTVTWTIPQAEYFNGPLRNAVIFYRCQRGDQYILGNVTVSNTTARSVAIHAVKPSDKCHVWMKLCNEPGQLCSGISRMCLTAGSAKDNSSPTSKNSKHSVVTTLLAALAGTGGGFVLVALIILCYRRRQNKNRRPPLAAILNLPPIHGYNEIEEPPMNDSYDEIDVQPRD